MELMVMLVVIYLRVSTGDQFKRGFSIPEQRAACRERAHALAAAEERRTGRKVDLQIIEFTDAISGEVLERPELDRVREFIRTHRPAYFVCLDPDRFSRTTYHAIFVANEIEKAGTKLEFVQFDYQTTDEGKLFFTLRVAIAQYEKGKIKERTSRGKRGKIAAGGLPTGLNMFGYQYNKLTQEVTPHSEEAPWVTQMFLWASQGIGTQTIADRLNAAGVRTKRGGARWYRATISKILRNRGYVGQLQVNRYDTRGLGIERQLPQERRTRKITFTQRPKEEWVTIAIPPLITEDLWNQATNARPTDPEGKAQRRTGLLSGMMVCGYCGGPVWYRPHKTLGQILMCANRYPYNRDRKRPEPICRLLPHQGARPIEDYVWNTLCNWLIDPDLVEEALGGPQPDRPDPTAPVRAELQLLERQLNDQLQQQARMLQVVAFGTVDPEVAAKQLEPYTRQIEHLRGAIKNLQGQLNQAVMAQEDRQRALQRFRAVRDEIMTATGDIRARLESLTPPLRQAVIGRHIERVLIYAHGQCQIRLKGQ